MARTYRGLTGKLLSLCDALGTAVRNRASGEPTSEDQLYQTSFLSRTAATGPRKRLLLRIKNGFARRCEESRILNFFSALLHRTLLLSARTVAVFFLAFLFGAAAVFASKAVLYETYPTAADSVFSAVLLGLILPLLFSDSNLYRLLQNSTLFGGFFKYVHPSAALRDGENTQASNGLFFVFGLVFGGLTWFTGLTVLPIVLLVLLFSALIFCFPEAGLLLILAVAPFLGLFDTPSLNLAVVVGFTFISLIFKALRGKKNLQFSVVSIPYILLLAGILLSAYSPFRGSVPAAALTAVLVLGYFLTSNLFRNEKFLSGAATAISVSASFVALLGVVQYMLGTAPSGWVDSSLFTSITSRTVSVFDNPNVLGAYLTVTFPFVLSKTCSVHGTANRVFGLVGSALVLTCGILTWSRACWIGLLLGLLVFSVRLSPRGLLLIPASALGVGAAACCIPGAFSQRLGHLFSLSDSANNYRVHVWNGVMQALKHYWFTGIGSGDFAFRAVYIQYALGGAEAAPHSHSIYLQLCLSSGIVTLLAFLCFVVFLLKKGGKATFAAEASDTPAVLSAAFASVIAMLVCGFVDNVFYNYRVLFLFFCVCGICSAAADVVPGKLIYEPNRPESADISIKLRKGGK